MFERETYLAGIVVAILVFFTGNHIIALHRNSVLSAISASESKADIMASLGTAKEIYNCQTSTTSPALFKKEDWCQGKVVEVAVFPRCWVSIACPGWNYVAFDEAGRPLIKFEWVAPLFPGGPAL